MKYFRLVVAGLLASCGVATPIHTPAQNQQALSAGFTSPLSIDVQSVQLVSLGDGGVVATSWVGTAEFVPATNGWTLRSPPPVALASPCVARLPGGRILRAGGNSGARDTLVFDPASNSWSAAGLLANGRTRASCGALADGRVVIVGGFQSGNFVSSAEVFNPATNGWSPLPAPVSGHSDTPAVLLNDGRLLFPTSFPEVYDPANNSFALVGGQGDGAPLATLIADGRVLLVGPTSARLWNPTSQLFEVVGAPTQRSNAVLVAHGNGAILLGGRSPDGLSSLTTVERFDPTTGTWATAPSLLQAREQGAAASLPNGFVLAVGARVFVPPSTTSALEAARAAEVLNLGCVPLNSCASVGAVCGSLNDGCGTILNCGACGSGLVCSANQCTACVPATCPALGFSCGSAPDGCGGTLQCGTCSGGVACTSNQCAAPSNLASYDGVRRAPACAAAGASCDTGPTLVSGRGPLGPETNAPNTLNSTCPDGTAGTFGADESLNRLKVSTLDSSYLAPGKQVRVDATVVAFAATVDVLDVFVASSADAPLWAYLGSAPSTASGLQTLSVVGTLPPAGTPRMAIRAQFRYQGSASTCSTGPYDDRDDLVFNAAPPDLVGPVLTVSSPVAAAVLRGPSAVDGTATDPSGIQEIAMLVDGALAGTTGTSPFSLPWNSATVADGPHTLSVRARDLAGNLTTISRAVTTSNAPQVTVFAPLPETTVAGAILLRSTLEAVAGRSITTLDFSVDGQAVGSRTAPPWEVDWNSRAVANGPHSLSATATDSFGATSTVVVDFNTDNDFTGPSIVLGSPLEGALVRQTASIEGSASDDRGAFTLELRVDGVLLVSSSTSPFSTPWDSASATDGPHTIVISATDSAGNVTTLVRSFVSDNTPPSVVLSSPAAGIRAEGLIPLEASSSDESGISRVDFFRNGLLLGSATSAPFVWVWDSTGQGGSQVVSATAVDLAGNVQSSAPVTVTIAVNQVAVFDPALRVPSCAAPSTRCSTGSLVVGRGPLGPEPNRPNTLGTCNDGSGGTFHATGQSIDGLSIASSTGGPLAAGTTAVVSVTVWSTQSADRVDVYASPSATTPTWTLVATLRPTVRNAASTLSTTLTIPASGQRAIRAALRTTSTAAPCPSGSRNDRDDLVFMVP
jgi:hypothetical protein